MTPMQETHHADDVIRRLTHWGEGQPTVRAMLLTSTRAMPGATVDRFSDYDAVLVVTDIRPFFEDRGWLGEFGKVLVVYRDPIKHLQGFEKFAYVTQYEDGMKIDFTLWPVGVLAGIVAAPELPDDLDVGYAVLLDKESLTRGLKAPTHRAHVPPRPTASDYATLVEDFFHEATYVAKHLARDDLLPVKYNLDHAMKQVNLRKMLEWRIEIDARWSLKPGAYGKGLKKHLSPEVWSELEKTYAGAAREENWEALFRTIRLFRRIAIEVGEHLGYAYPHDFDRRVVSYVERVRSG